MLQWGHHALINGASLFLSLETVCGYVKKRRVKIEGWSIGCKPCVECDWVSHTERKPCCPSGIHISQQASIPVRTRSHSHKGVQMETEKLGEEGRNNTDDFCSTFPKLSVCVTWTHNSLLAFCAHSPECYRSNCCAGLLHLTGISVTLADKAREDNGAMLVARRPLALMSQDAPQGKQHSVNDRQGWEVRGRQMDPSEAIPFPYKCSIYNAPVTAQGIAFHSFSRLFFFFFCRDTSILSYFTCLYSCLLLTLSFCQHASLHAAAWIEISVFICCLCLFHHQRGGRRNMAGWHCVCTVKAVK